VTELVPKLIRKLCPSAPADIDDDPGQVGFIVKPNCGPAAFVIINPKLFRLLV
jgi:hypothetical protein